MWWWGGGVHASGGEGLVLLHGGGIPVGGGGQGLLNDRLKIQEGMDNLIRNRAIDHIELLHATVLH